MLTKKQLAIKLSKLKGFRQPKIKLEQYVTPSEIAADLLWNAYMLNDIKNKIVLDACSGTGILGIGALLLDAKKVIFVEIDKDVENLIKENIENFYMGEKEEKKYEIVIEDIKKSRKKFKVDTIIMNPPFGTINRHSDIEILRKVREWANIIYCFHLAATEDYIKKKAKDLKLQISNIWKYRFLIKSSLKFHKKEKHYTDIIVVRYIRK